MSELLANVCLKWNSHIVKKTALCSFFLKKDFLYLYELIVELCKKIPSQLFEKMEVPVDYMSAIFPERFPVCFQQTI